MITPYQAPVAISLVEVGNNYFLYGPSGTGPALKYGGADVFDGENGDWQPIAAMQTATGYDVVWKEASTGEYGIWMTDSNGNYVSATPAMSGTSSALEAYEPLFNKDLNGDGIIGTPPPPPPSVIQTDNGAYGSTSLVEVGTGYFLYGSGGSGPALKYGGVGVVAGQNGDWQPIGAVKTASGYDVVFEETSTGEFGIWMTDSNGNYVSATPAMSGTSSALESYELTFDQDLNGDGTIGVPPPSPPLVIQTDTNSFGTTRLVEVGTSYFLYGSGVSGPALEYGGVGVVAGQNGDWQPIGAAKTASGYDVAFEETSTGEFGIWMTDGNGNYVSATPAMSGTSSALESYELTFNQDLNGDHVIGPPPPSPPSVIQTDTNSFGTTSLVEVGTSYFLYGSGGSGPALEYGGVGVVAGQNGDWQPIGAAQTASGYDVVWKETSTGQYGVWMTNSSGNFVSATPAMSGTSSALESYELVLNQDLNGDHIIGSTPPVVIQTDTNSIGSTSLVEVGTSYFLYGSGGYGPALKYGGVGVVAGQNGDWQPIGAVQTASGYDVVWKETSTGEYGIWMTDGSGNYTSATPAMSGTSATLESYELVFNQDLNSDGVIDTSSTVINASGDIVLSVNPFTQAATIAAGATLELTGADTGSVTFNGATGTLALDQSSAFGGNVYGFTGTGNLASSDEIDLKDIDFASATKSFVGTSSSGTLTVSDGHNTANIKLEGDYTSSTFSLFTDGNNGTLVIDPPINQASAGSTSSVNAQDTTGTRTAGVSPQRSGPASVAGVTLDPVISIDGQGSLGWHFNVDSNPISQTIAQSYTGLPAAQAVSVKIGDPRTNTAATQPITSGGSGATRADETGTETAQPLFRTTEGGDDNAIDAGNRDAITAANVSAAKFLAASVIVRPSSDPVSDAVTSPAVDDAPAGSDALPANAVDRDSLSPRDLIRAINDGNIAIKVGHAGGQGTATNRQIWLFDEAQGAFVAPDPEPLTIVIDRPDAIAAPVHSDHTLGLVATAAMVSFGSSWLGTLRHFGRKATRAVQQGAKWTE